MSASFELGRVTYNHEHSDAIATCRVVDETMIANMIAAVNNQYISGALTKDSKDLILNVISTHLSYKSKVLKSRQADLKDGSNTISADIEMGKMSYYHENDLGDILSILADEQLIGNMICTLNNPDITVMLSKEEFTSMVNAVATHIAMKSVHVRARQEEVIAINNRVGYSI